MSVSGPKPGSGLGLWWPNGCFAWVAPSGREAEDVDVNQSTRACVAYVAGRLISGSVSSYIYDYSQSRHISIGGSVSGSAVNVYDYDRGCHFAGSPGNLYDYGRSTHVSLNIDGSQFSGYDYGDSCHYSGTVNGNSISIYDHGESQHFSYSL
jgi:hypothetical protein